MVARFRQLTARLSEIDPHRVAARWLIRHRAWLAIVAIVWFVAMLPFAEIRWSAVATLWGVLGAGLIVALVLQEQGESIQVNAWLRTEAAHVLPFITQVFQRARLLTIGYGVPVDVVNGMLSESGDARNAVYERGRAAIANMSGRSDGASLVIGALKPESIQHLEFRLQELDALAQANEPLLARLTQLHAMMRRLIEAGSLLAGMLRSPGMSAEAQLIVLGSVARCALDLCECCQQIEDRAVGDRRPLR